MKNLPLRFFKLTGITAALAIIASGCGAVPGSSVKRIPAGYVGLKVELYGENRGVQNATISTGKVWYNGYTEEIVKPRFDESIEAQITARFQAEQQAVAAKAQLEVAEAESKRKIAEARGEAEASRIKASTVSPLTIRLRELELQEEMIKKWDGILPTYLGGTAPFPSFDPNAGHSLPSASTAKK
ncbi:hypothetical protein [Coleofasciculus sp. F4-SAH-05]|uniref:hypothetical protein n=1 Tax=Coleofasciculus sp. F4-SAH-05 TaxID=3069525 RepID=UPI0032FA2990